jgi:hypothetical protein
MSQRNVGEDDVAFVIAFGRRLFRTGVEIYFLGRRDVPARYAREAEHLVGTVVIVARDSSVITVYRNARAHGTLKRKHKRDRDAAQSFRLSDEDRWRQAS